MDINTIEKLRVIKNHILEEPKRLDMYDWQVNTKFIAETLRPSCGSVGCIAFWAQSLFPLNPSNPTCGILDKARIVLELTSRESCLLFYSNDWPDEYAYSYQLLRAQLYTTNTVISLFVLKQLAKITADRIDFFILTNGTDQIRLSRGRRQVRPI